MPARRTERSRTSLTLYIASCKSHPSQRTRFRLKRPACHQRGDLHERIDSRRSHARSTTQLANWNEPGRHILRDVFMIERGGRFIRDIRSVRVIRKTVEGL